MKRALSVLLLTGFASCTVGGVDVTQPTAALTLTGNYRLAVTAAERCDLSVTHYEWDLVATQGTTRSDTAVMTLAGGDRRVHLVFCGSCQADPQNVLGDLDTEGPPKGDAPVPGGFKLRAQLTLTGRVEVGADGRGTVPSGVAEGSLELSREEDEDSDALGSCLSDINSFSLSPR